MSNYKVPHYATLGVSLLLITEEGEILSVPLAFEELGESGIEGAIGRLVESFEKQGMRPISEEEYGVWAGELAAGMQRTRIAEALHEMAQRRAVDPERLDALLRAHRGAPGGDA